MYISHIRIMGIVQGSSPGSLGNVGYPLIAINPWSNVTRSCTSQATIYVPNRIIQSFRMDYYYSLLEAIHQQTNNFYLE